MSVYIYIYIYRYIDRYIDIYILRYIALLRTEREDNSTFFVCLRNWGVGIVRFESFLNIPPYTMVEKY